MDAAHTVNMKPRKAPIEFLFLDLETTGFDREGDDIIEIGAIGVDADLNTLFEFTTVIEPTMRTLGLIENNPPVLKMTEANGLAHDLRNGGGWLPSLSVAIADLAVLVDLRTATPGAKITLAGSGVATFDFQFLKAQAPEFAARFNYWCNDIGDTRRRWRAATGGDLVTIDSTKNHRAFDDVTIHLEEARRYRTVFAALAQHVGASDFDSVMGVLTGANTAG